VEEHASLENESISKRYKNQDLDGMDIKRRE
jgi:hypothetical protein